MPLTLPLALGEPLALLVKVTEVLLLFCAEGVRGEAEGHTVAVPLRVEFALREGDAVLVRARASEEEGVWEEERLALPLPLLPPLTV